MKIKILKVFSVVIFKVQRQLICREDSIIILREMTLSLILSFKQVLWPRRGGIIELIVSGERRERPEGEMNWFKLFV